MLDAANQQFCSISQKNKMKMQPVKDLLNEEENILKKQHQQ